MACQVIEQAELGGGGGHRFATYPQHHGPRIDVDFADAHRSGRERPFKAPQYRFHSGHQLARTKRLRDVVIAAEFKPQDAVGFTTFGSEKDDWSHGYSRRLTNTAAELQTIAARNHDVEEEQHRPVTFSFGDHAGARSK